jgi:hypothetical protein
MSPDVIFALPGAFWVLLGVLATLAVGLVFFALYTKGDVSAEFSHGLTSLKLEAKDRVRGKS